jgi:hypothetical protein
MAEVIMYEQWSFPRQQGDWSELLRWLEIAWKNGRETEAVEGFLSPVDFMKCPVCGESVHTSKHIATARINPLDK